MPDSQPGKWHMGPVPTDYHDFDFKKKVFLSSCLVFVVFSPGRPEVGFSSFSVGTNKLRGEQLRRFVVVSPREVPSLTFSYPFKLSVFRSF